MTLVARCSFNYFVEKHFIFHLKRDVDCVLENMPDPGSRQYFNNNIDNMKVLV